MLGTTEGSPRDRKVSFSPLITHEIRERSQRLCKNILKVSFLK
jgi:hypothetical protein